MTDLGLNKLPRNPHSNFGFRLELAITCYTSATHLLHIHFQLPCVTQSIVFQPLGIRIGVFSKLHVKLLSCLPFVYHYSIAYCLGTIV